MPQAHCARGTTNPQKLCRRKHPRQKAVPGAQRVRLVCQGHNRQDTCVRRHRDLANRCCEHSTWGSHGWDIAMMLEPESN